MENNHSLYHYGVKGMRWGVKRVHTRDKYVHGKKVASKGDEAKGGIFGVRSKLTRVPNTKNTSSEQSKAKRKAIGKKVALAAFAAWGATVTINTIKDYRAGDFDTRFAIDFIKDIFSKR